MEATQLLRARVLDLAVRGRLVPQNPHDEPVSELFSSIDEERMRLFKEGRIKKKDFVSSHIYRDEEGHFLEKVGKSAPICIDDEIPFDIPETWQWVRLGQIFGVIMGQSPDGGSVSQGEDGVEFHQGKIEFTDRVIGPSSFSTTLPKKMAPANSLLLCVRAPVGVVNVTDREICIGRGLCALEPLKVDLSFFFWMFHCLIPVFESKSSGSTFKAITLRVVENQLLPLPPLAEQRRIVEVVDKAFESIRDIEASVAALESYKQSLRASLLEEAIRGRLVEQKAEEGSASDLLPEIEKERMRLYEEGKLKKKDLVISHIYRSDDGHFYERVGKKAPLCIDDQIPFDIPDSWQWVRGKYVNRIISGVTYAKGDIVNNQDGIRILRGGNIKDGSIVLLDDDVFLPASYPAGSVPLSIGDCCMVFSTGSEKVIGKVAMVSSTDLEGVYVGAFLRVLRPYPSVLSKYIFYYYSTRFFHDYVRDVASGTAINNLKISYLYESLFPLPPLAEQRRIVERLDQLMAEVEKL